VFLQEATQFHGRTCNATAASNNLRHVLVGNEEVRFRPRTTP
jgi:hypothetical protein